MGFREKFFEYMDSKARKSYFVPQLGEKVYWTPITVLEIEKIRTLAGGDRKEMNIWTLIEKAEDEEGKKIFTVNDKPFLENQDFTIVYGICDEMMKTQPLEEVKKTSEKTPSD